MKIEISDYYKSKGYNKAYLYLRKSDGRYGVVLHGKDRKLTGMLYSRYLYTSHYKCDIAKGEEVDHINGDKSDDKIENLQVISKSYNIRKGHRIKEKVVLICPICKEEFYFDKRNLSTHPNPCCSRKCGGKKSINTAITNGNLDKRKKQHTLDIDSIKIDIENHLRQAEIAKKYKISVSTLKRFISSNGVKMK